MSKLVLSLFHDEAGVTAAEYGLIVALISLAIFIVTTSLGSSLAATFTAVANMF